MDSTKRMPAAFLGHGSPMNTLESNRYTASWRAFGRAVPRPRAILAVSAHWYINGTAVTAMARPRTIHDFYGFPPELFAFQYPAPGAPDVAEEVAEAVKPDHVGRDTDSWGLDHGTWSVLAHVFPEADIPVVQLSIHAGKPEAYHLEVGRRLASLRERGILVVASGNIVHNLRRIDFRRHDLAFDWALRFDAAVRDTMTSAPTRVTGLSAHADYALSVPTPEHWLPLLYIAGIADASGEPARPFAEGCTMGSISMTSYALGATDAMLRKPGEEADAAPLPDPRVMPAEDTNT